MAERRMFAKTIIDSDAFLDMPQTTQLLYFHLSMRADDDGFINNPRSIMRNARCTEDDLKVLVSKKFIIPFENGIVVIKHWKIHNYIAKDRYKETKYKEEKSTLFLDENNAYTRNVDEMYTDCIQTVYELETQDRLGKDRLGKDSIREGIDFSQIVDLYHSICVSYPRIKALSDARKKAIKARLNVYTLDDFETMFKKAEESDFLKGANSRNWTATFDWMIKDANMAKILDGNYDISKTKSQTASSGSEPYFKDNLMNILTGKM